MKKKFSYLLFVFIGLFFLNLHVKADFNVTGLTSNLPSCSSSTYPTFLEEDIWYSCVFEWAVNYALNVNNHPQANPSINNTTTIFDFPYVVGVSYISPSSSSHFDYDLLFFESEPEIVTYNGNKVIKSTGGVFQYSRYWYNNNSRRAGLYYRDSLQPHDQPYRYLLNNFSNNSNYDRIYSGFNVVFDNVNTISNFPQNNYFILPFSFGNLVYNSTFLDNNSNWTKQCLNSQNTFFSVLPNNIDTSNHDLVNNYILFPQLLYDYGINWLQYNTINFSSLYENNYDLEGLYDYKFSSKEEMDIMSTNYYIQDFNSRYPGLYNNLYGWNMFLNRLQYTDDDKYNIQVFHLNNSYTESFFCHTVGGSTYCEDANGNIHGGGGRELGSVVDTPERDICFYIPSDMYLKVWEINEYNDIDDTIILNGTDYNVDTDSYQFGYYNNINNNTYSGYVGYFKALINVCSVPLNFISNKITLFFNLMPPLIQYAIITFVFVLFVVGLIKFLTGGK